VVVRREFFSWSQLESKDYPTYIANLRNVGCPEQTIRDIIIADVNALYARKEATDIVTPDQEWWRTEPDTNLLATAREKLRALDEERRALLTRLLGPNWESEDLVGLARPSSTPIPLDGPVLGALPTDVKKAVQIINQKAQEKIQAYLTAQREQGKTPDPAELARLRQETRNELAEVLSPQQLEEFLLRYSATADSLRRELGQLRYFHVTQSEFKNVFDATDPIDQQLAALSGNDPNTAELRASLEQQRDNAIKNVLGDSRYQEFVRLHDPAYQSAMAQAQQAGSPDSTMRLYQIGQAAAQQQQSILANTNLNAGERDVELKQLQLQQAQAAATALGQLPPEPPPTPPPMPFTVHTVKAGESIGNICQIYEVTINALRAVNPGVNLNNLSPGDSIKIPK
ncbi:MAG TPA: LysM domain-containing protein, partial [Verrucomicrobiae bacterium]|nr:LysM domain-containing protein [Verrucomicrobiae bacterium]